MSSPVPSRLLPFAVQKHSKNLGSFEEGNTLSCEQLQTYLDGAYGPGVVSVRKDLIPRWREGVLDSLLSNRDRLMASWKGRTRSFELFGYDFMVDEDFRSWLIEVVSCQQSFGHMCVVFAVFQCVTMTTAVLSHRH